MSAYITRAQQLLRWATMPEQSGPKSGGCCAPLRLGAGSATPHLTQCRLGRGLRPHYADLTTAPLAARTSTSHFQDRRPGFSVSDRPCTRVSGRRLSAYFRRQYAPTPIDRHSDLRRQAFKQQLRRPVFCSCRTTSVEHVASTATAL